MGANENMAQAVTRHMVTIDRNASKAARDAIALLEELEKELVAKIRKFKRDAKSEPTMTQVRTIALLDQIRDAIGQTYLDIADGFDEALEKQARREVRFVNDLLNEAIGVDISTVQFSEKLLMALVENASVEGKPASEWWSEQPKRDYKRFVKKIRKAFATGETTDDTIAWIAGTKKNKYKDGNFAVSKAQATALARTAFNRVANDARMKAYQENQDIMRGYVQISHLDERTSDICEDYAGQEWDLNYKPIPPSTLPFKDGCPRHFNCRSVISPLLKTWNELAGEKFRRGKGKGFDLDKAADGEGFEELYRKRLAEKGFSSSDTDAIVERRRAELNDAQVRRLSFEIQTEREAMKAERQALKKAKEGRRS
jgi:SPP1 gp7 family putative phage head morphogenesis protein